MGDGKIFKGEPLFVERRDSRRKFKDARAPRNELLADELKGSLPAKLGAPSQDDRAGILFILKLLFHCHEEKLLIGIAVGGETHKGRADRSDFVRYVGRIRGGLLKLILEQEPLDLVVIDADGNDDRAESAIMSGEALAHFLRGAVEMAKGEKSVDARAD